MDRFVDCWSAMIQLGIAAALGCILFAEYMRRKTQSIEANILYKVESMLGEMDVCSECLKTRENQLQSLQGQLPGDKTPGCGLQEEDGRESLVDDVMLHRQDILDIMGCEDEKEDGWLIHVG